MSLFPYRYYLPCLLLISICFSFFCPPVNGETIAIVPISKSHLEVNKNDWRTFQNAGPESKVETTCSINNSPCTLTYHGSPRSRRDANRPSYRVSLPEQTLILKAEAFDSTMLKEWLGYFIFEQAGIITPVAGPVTLQINNGPISLYVAITTVDDHTIEKLHPEDFNKAALYYGYIKKAGENRIRPDLQPATDLNFYHLAYEEVVSPTSEKNFTPLDELLRSLNNPPEHREEASTIDIPQWIRWFAVSEIIANRDSPWFSGSRNYSLFRPPSGGWQILPWDLDRIYEGKGDFFPTSQVTGTMKLTSMPWFQKAVREEVGQLVRGRLHHDTILSALNKMSDIIAPAIVSGSVVGLNPDIWDIAITKFKHNIVNRHRQLLSQTSEKK